MQKSKSPKNRSFLQHETGKCEENLFWRHKNEELKYEKTKDSEVNQHRTKNKAQRKT